jgi:hypothetical protein
MKGPLHLDGEPGTVRYDTQTRLIESVGPLGAGESRHYQIGADGTLESAKPLRLNGGNRWLAACGQAVFNMLNNGWDIDNAVAFSAGDYSQFDIECCFTDIDEKKLSTQGRDALRAFYFADNSTVSSTRSRPLRWGL